MSCPCNVGRSENSSHDGGGALDLGELGPYSLGVGMVHRLQDLQRAPPCRAGLAGLARCVVRVSNVAQRLGHAVRVVDTLVQLDRPAVTHDGLGVAPETVVREAEAVPGGGFGLPVTEPA